MSSVKPIRTQADYEAALEMDELALLADLVDEYEKTGIWENPYPPQRLIVPFIRPVL